jgi:predicted dehydrogenase
MRGVLIGCGFFAANHMRAWAGLEGVDIVAVCDTDPAKARAYARDFGAMPFTDAAVMLREVQPDFADIATTVASHRALVTLAAEHCRAVICQKPFAATIEDGAAMVDACREKGVALLVHENFRWQAPYRALAAAVASGVIGPPTFLRLSFRHAHDIYTNQPYLAAIEDLALTDVGLHLFDMARAVMGEVSLVACQTQRLNPRVAGQDAFLASLRHTSGAVSSVECSFYSHYAPDPFVQTLAVVEGPLGSIELLQGYRMRLHKDGKVTETAVEPEVPSWGARPWHLVQEAVIAFQRHALAVMRGEDEAQPSGADNLRTLAVTFAAIRSAASSQAVVPDDFA